MKVFNQTTRAIGLNPNLIYPYSRTVKVGGGSGFLIDKKGNVLTCAHVIDNVFLDECGYSKNCLRVDLPEIKEGHKLKNLELIFCGKKIVSKKSTLLYIGVYDKKCKYDDSAPLLKYVPDLAVINIPELKGRDPIYLANDYPGVDESAFIIGNPNSKPTQSIYSGRFLEIRKSMFANSNDDELVLDCENESGNSGGPVLDSEGKVHGVLSQGSEKMGIAVPVHSYIPFFAVV